MVRKNYYESRGKKMNRKESDNTSSGTNENTNGSGSSYNKNRSKSYGSRQPKEIQQQRDNSPRPRTNSQVKRETTQHTRENPQRPRENLQPRNYHYSGRRVERVKAVETVEDIKKDIIRIEKEIDLEIKEIRSLKL